jgi:hypothetical protein
VQIDEPHVHAQEDLAQALPLAHGEILVRRLDEELASVELEGLAVVRLRGARLTTRGEPVALLHRLLAGSRVIGGALPGLHAITVLLHAHVVRLPQFLQVGLEDLPELEDRLPEAAPRLFGVDLRP